MPSITSVPNPAVNAARPAEPQPAATTAASSAPAETPGSNGPGLLQSAINAGKGFLYRQLASVPERAMNTASAVINAGAGLYRQAISAPEQVVAGASDLVHARTNSFYSQKAGTPEQALTSAAAMKNYLAWGGDVQARDESGKTLLHRAAFPGGGKVFNEDVFKEVLTHVNKMEEGKRKEILNAPTDTNNHFALSPLGLAAAGGSTKAALLLMDTPGVDLNAKNNLGMTPLMCAIQGMDMEICRALLNKEGVDVNATDKTGRTATLIALAKDVEFDGKGKLIPLSADTKSKSAELLKMLLTRSDLEPDKTETKSKMTATMWAARTGHEEAVEILLASGRVNPNRHNAVGFTPLAYAALEGHRSLFKKMMDHESVDPNYKVPVQDAELDLLLFVRMFGPNIIKEGTFKPEDVVWVVEHMAEHRRVADDGKIREEARKWVTDMRNLLSSGKLGYGHQETVN